MGCLLVRAGRSFAPGSTVPNVGRQPETGRDEPGYEADHRRPRHDRAREDRVREPGWHDTADGLDEVAAEHLALTSADIDVTALIWEFFAAR
jgi:hypothetical protein